MRWTATVRAACRAYRRAFSREPKPPLTQAHRHVDAIINLLYHYWFDPNFRPSTAEIRSLLLLERRLFDLHAIGRRLALRLDRRFHGEPEIDEP